MTTIILIGTLIPTSNPKRYMADITLYCYFLGTPINSAIPVDIGETTRVEGVDVPIEKFSFGHLKKQILPNNNEANKLRLWKFETPFKKDNEKLKLLNENFHNDTDLEQELGEYLSPGELIRTIFPVGYVFSPNHIHIIVQPPSSPATTGKRKAEDSDKDQNSKRVKLADPKIISTARRIMEDIMKLDENETIYSDPKNFLSLPYPYLGEKLPIDRFDIDHDGSFIFMGRTKFEQVLEDINKLRPRSYMKLFIYGTVGYGKSHILTAIACFLFRTRRRVVFLPDCRQLAVDPVEYIKLALFLTYENDDVKISEINACEDFCQIIKFCKSLEEKLYFIVDQMNALDEGDNTGISLEKKRQIRENLDKMVDNHFYIMSSSANNKTMLYLMAKQTGELKIKLFGGFDEGEMKEWWNKHNSDWIGSCMEDAKIFKKILQRVKEKIPPKDTARLNELNKFGTGEDELNQKILQAINDICSLTEVNALKIDTINWYEDATANIHTLKREVNKCKKNTIYETMWTRIEGEEATLKRVFNKKKKFLTIFNINIKGDVMEIWCMRKEDGIYKYCLLDKAPIPLQITPANVIYSFIHLLLTLRTAVACTLFKINNDNSVKEYESDESEDTNTSITITTPQHHN
ncbi:unnamed protein product [Rhizophagus irregularis]|nr:unnamed protein product [Rhizophagus irregularis]